MNHMSPSMQQARSADRRSLDETPVHTRAIDDSRSWRDRVLALADAFVPLQPDDSEESLERARLARTAVVVAWLGCVFSSVFAVLYVILGSPWAGAAIAPVAIGLAFVHLAVRRAVPLTFLGNFLTSLIWLGTFLVAARTGGFSSPALVWSFLHPITTYAVCGRRSASAWAGLAIVQIAVFYGAERFGFVAAEDLTAQASSVLRVSGYVGCVLANVSLIATVEGVRVSSQRAIDRANRTLERQRILGDMHDGVGSQLLGLMIQVRSKQIDEDRLYHGLSSCLDDLRLIVDSLDPSERSFELAVAELRTRVEPRCHAQQIEIDWTTDEHPPDLSAEQTLQVLRALQEMTNNALRHSGTTRLEVSSGRTPGDPDDYQVVVRDYGIGCDPQTPGSVGRGMTSLHSRAHRLGGVLIIERLDPGVRFMLRFPVTAKR